MAKDLAIVLNNGSINSAVTTALAAQKYRPILLHAQVSSQPGLRTREAYDQQIAHFKPYREHTAPMAFFSAIQGPPQARQMTDPRLTPALAPQLIELLPLIAVAMRFAAHYQAASIHLGLRVGGNSDDLAQATEFTQVLNELIQMPCHQPELDVHAPLLELEPWQVVDAGFQVNAPFDKTWSCYEEVGEPCWSCRGCKIREAAFMQAGKPDPLRPVRKV